MRNFFFILLSCFFSIFFVTASSAQELPPKLGLEQALDGICAKWVGKRVDKFTINPENCLDVTSKILINVADLFSDLDTYTGQEISGEFTFNQIKAKRQSENTDCSNPQYLQTEYFKTLPYVMTCRSNDVAGVVLYYFGSEDEYVGGLSISMGFPGLIDPKGDKNSALFVSDIINIGMQGVLPGHIQLNFNLDTETMDIRAYYLRAPLSTKSGKWKGYVIKVYDYGLLYGHEKIKKMIFPISIKYNSETECYREFEKLVSKEPLNSRYPQTNDASSSYLFGCIEE